MSRLAEEALRAGACGVSTSQTILHSSKHGLVPGTHAMPEELIALGEAVGRAGHGVFQLISDHQGGAGRPELAGRPRRPHRDHRHLHAGPGRPRAATPGASALAGGRGGPRRPVAGSSRRWPTGPPGCCSGCSRRSTRSSPTPPTGRSPTCRWPSGWPRCASPRCGPRSWPRSPTPRTRSPAASCSAGSQMFPLGDPPDYEPPSSASVAAVAAREGRSTRRRSCSTGCSSEDGRAFLFAPLASYVDHNLDAIHEMMTDPNTVLGLSDGGAHCGLICDVSMPTYLLTHWVNGRSRGDAARRSSRRSACRRRAPRRPTGSPTGACSPPASGPTSTSSTSTGMRLHAPEMVSTSRPAAAA